MQRRRVPFVRNRRAENVLHQTEMAKISTHPTPNPNSLKITRGDRFIESGLESFSSVSEAGDHPLGAPLIAIDGVANVFIVPDFLTITKTPGSRWDDVLSAVKSVLEG